MESMDENTRRMAAQLEAYQAYIAQLTGYLAQLTAAIVELQGIATQITRLMVTPPQAQDPGAPLPEVPELEDLLDGAVPEPAPQAGDRS